MSFINGQSKTWMQSNKEVNETNYFTHLNDAVKKDNV